MTIERAIQIATEIHETQQDKGGQPYILHALRVMLGVPIGDAQIVGVLHDAVEDGGSLDDIRDAGFSPEVVGAIDALTRRDGETYAEYIERVAANPLASVVKVADLWDNLVESRIPNPTGRDHQRWGKYRKALERLRGGPSLEPSQETTEKAEAAVADYIAQLCHSDSERKGWARRIVKLVVGGLRAVPSQESGPSAEDLGRVSAELIQLGARMSDRAAKFPTGTDYEGDAQQVRGFGYRVRRIAYELLRGASPSGRGDPQEGAK